MYGIKKPSQCKAEQGDKHYKNKLFFVGKVRRFSGRNPVPPSTSSERVADLLLAPKFPRDMFQMMADLMTIKNATVKDNRPMLNMDTTLLDVKKYSRKWILMYR